MAKNNKLIDMGSNNIEVTASDGTEMEFVGFDSSPTDDVQPLLSNKKLIIENELDDAETLEEVPVNRLEKVKEEIIEEDTSEDMVVSKNTSSIDDDSEFKLLKEQAEREAMHERLLEAQYQIQQLNDRIKNINESESHKQINDTINSKKNELEQARQEYIKARQSYDTNAELAAMKKYGDIDFEIKQLESRKINNNTYEQPTQQQVEYGYDPNLKSREKLNQFISKPENAWMIQAFDKALNPITADGLIASNVMKELLDKGGHPGTDKFWDLLTYQLKRTLPTKYASHYGKGAPAMSSGGDYSQPAKKTKGEDSVKLQPWQINLAKQLANGDKEKYERVKLMLAKEAKDGLNRDMFEFNV